PFLNARSVLNGISPDSSINLNKWRMGNSNHFDIMQALSQTGNFAWVSLNITARVLGVEVPEDQTSGAEMDGFYKAGNWEEIVKHNTHDVEMTEAIYLKIKDVF
ncbi:MAG: ribonuclease H-like domain-containing protein, partial [Thermoplasmata archaeon]|nr:ribonuclease H-like domain-containing protein [Thermoplasmata archaeon]